MLNGAGYIAQNPVLACTFVDNPDTDTSDGEAVTTAKLFAYAFILTAEGYPFVYGKDYFPPTVWPGAYGLKHWIDNLIWIYETLANGPTVTRYVDAKVIVLNRTGWPGLLTALNFDTWNARTITCDTGFGPGVALHDYTGRHPTSAPTAMAGRPFEYPAMPTKTVSLTCAFHAPTLATNTTQPARNHAGVFGASDLDIAPATPGAQVLAGRIWCKAGSPILAGLPVHPSGGMRAADVSFSIASQSGQHLIGGPPTSRQLGKWLAYSAYRSRQGGGGQCRV